LVQHLSAQPEPNEKIPHNNLAEHSNDAIENKCRVEKFFDSMALMQH
jgi:hypothetical protein